MKHLESNAFSMMHHKCFSGKEIIYLVFMRVGTLLEMHQAVELHPGEENVSLEALHSRQNSFLI